jgi:hypothetical protein
MTTEIVTYGKEASLKKARRMEKSREYSRRYYKKNKDARRAYSQKYYSEKRKKNNRISIELPTSFFGRLKLASELLFRIAVVSVKIVFTR